METTTTRKKILAPRTHSTTEMYKFYVAKNESDKKRPTPYWMYKEVLARFNKKVSNDIIFGQSLNLGNRLGYVQIRKIRRNYDKPIPDWGESKRIKADLIKNGIVPKDENHPEGKEWIVYYTDPWYLRWAWIKRKVCKVKNHTVYKFIPTSNRSKTAGDNTLEKLGNKGKLAYANKLNPMLHNSYENLTGKLNYKTRQEYDTRKSQNEVSRTHIQEYKEESLSSIQ